MKYVGYIAAFDRRRGYWTTSSNPNVPLTGSGIQAMSAAVTQLLASANPLPPPASPRRAGSRTCRASSTAAFATQGQSVTCVDCHRAHHAVGRVERRLHPERWAIRLRRGVDQHPSFTTGLTSELTAGRHPREGDRRYASSRASTRRCAGWARWPSTSTPFIWTIVSSELQSRRNGDHRLQRLPSHCCTWGRAHPDVDQAGFRPSRRRRQGPAPQWHWSVAPRARAAEPPDDADGSLIAPARRRRSAQPSITSDSPASLRRSSLTRWESRPGGAVAMEPPSGSTPSKSGSSMPASKSMAARCLRSSSSKVAPAPGVAACDDTPRVGNAPRRGDRRRPAGVRPPARIGARQHRRPDVDHRAGVGFTGTMPSRRSGLHRRDMYGARG